jgi:hypothetical protein
MCSNEWSAAARSLCGSPPPAACEAGASPAASPAALGREARVEAADALGERRVGGEERVEAAGQSAREEEVAGLRGIRAHQIGALLEAPDLLERARDALRVAGELDRRGVGEELALPAHRGLDHVAEEGAEEADHREADADRQHGEARVVAVAAATGEAGVHGRAHHEVADDADHEDAVEDPHEPDVEAHVAVQDVAELVGDDALELVARELLRRAARHRHHGVTRLEARREGVDAGLPIEEIDGRDLGTRRDRHLLHHVEDAPLDGVPAVRLQQPPAQALGHDAAAAGAQLGDLEQARPPHHQQRRQGDLDHQLGVDPAGLPDRRAGVGILSGVARHRDGQRVEGDRDGDHRETEEHDESPGALARLVLALEEVHGSRSSGRIRRRL